ncbi:hypothetical protein VTL71DRAFT_12349 [Oculimacula yallundae]|uniref:Uncharacterized protein n=1 Tax=Oculimacula yallundae TaxID=86028 RepID=A0ABR4CMU2_9HELO
MVHLLKDETKYSLFILDEILGVDWGPTHDWWGFRKEDTREIVYRHLFRPPCECSECKQQFRDTSKVSMIRQIMTYSEAYSDAEARKFANDMTSRILENFLYLKNKCASTGDTIMKRWRTKSLEQREEMLLWIDPKLYRKKWCDAYFSKEIQDIWDENKRLGRRDRDATDGRERRPFQKVCMLPYVNLETLAEDFNNLLHLLGNRIKYSPQQWASYDNFLLNKQWGLGSFEIKYNRNSIIMHGVDYGQYVDWIRDGAHNWTIIGFPRASLILQAQDLLLGFLRAFVDAINEEINPERVLLGSVKFFASLESGLRVQGDNPNTREFASTYLNQPFSPPPTFDIATILGVVQTRLHLHGDHLWLLQTDPGYFRRYSSLLLEGGLEDNLTQINKYKASTLVMQQDIAWFLSWEWLQEEVQKLQLIYNKIEESSGTDDTGLNEYLRSSGSLEALLLEQFRWRSDYIGQIIPLRPGFRRNWMTKYLQRLQSSAVEHARADPKALLPGYFFTDRLEFCLSGMFADHTLEHPLEITQQDEPETPEKTPVRRPRHDYSMLFGILDEYLSDCHKQGKRDEIARIDEVLYTLLTDLSAVHQILMMVQLNRPRGCRTELEEAQASETGTAWRYINKGFMNHQMWQGSGTPMKEPGKLKIAAEEHLGRLFTRFMECPNPETKSSPRSGMRERHKSALLRLGFGNEDVHHNFKTLSADEQPAHLKSVEAERKEVLAVIAEKEASRVAKLGRKPSNAVVQAQWGAPESKPEIDIAQTKQKIKTRSADEVADSMSSLAITSESRPDAALEERLQVQVNKRTLSIFKAMFPGSNPADRSRAIEWDAFISAMAEDGVGFVARHSAGGSAYTFEPNEKSLWYGKGAISFHKPHPEHVIDAINVMAHGKRMSKWFGWSEETFVLKK